MYATNQKKYYKNSDGKIKLADALATEVPLWNLRAPCGTMEGGKILQRRS